MAVAPDRDPIRLTLGGYHELTYYAESRNDLLTDRPDSRAESLGVRDVRSSGAKFCTAAALIQPSPGPEDAFYEVVGGRPSPGAGSPKWKPKTLATNPGRADPNHIGIDLDHGRVQISLEMGAATEMRADSSDDRADDDSAARNDIAFYDTVDSCFGTEDDLSRSAHTASDRAIDISPTVDRDLALKKSFAGNQGKSARVGGFLEPPTGLSLALRAVLSRRIAPRIGFPVKIRASPIVHGFSPSNRPPIRSRSSRLKNFTSSRPPPSGLGWSVTFV